MSNEFRISKYDIKKRINGVYTENDWTSMGDIGTVHNGKELTYDEYIKTENRYLKFIEAVLLKTNTQEIQVTYLEDYSKKCIHKKNEILSSVDDILNMSRDCLRENYWAKLECDNLFLHFGYDYYLYVGCDLSFTCINDLACELGLFVEITESPYKANDE